MELSGRTDPPGPDPGATELPPHRGQQQVDLEMENQEGRHLSEKEDGQRGSLCTDVGMSPLRVTLPGGHDLVDPSERPEVHATLPSWG